jgi:hypothetical protein
MQVHLSEDYKAVISMKTYITESMQELGLAINRESTTPAKKKLFELYPTAKRLDKVRSTAFHSILPRLLYVATRARIDIQFVVSLLCLRVSTSTVKDENKLRRLLE